MPFPPTFDHVWDTTQPPDTQLANLLGQDLRNLKDDVMQRISLLSGTIANRPTPETVNATWGGVGFGLMYFATDTGKIYQWNGASWTDITSSFIPSGVNNVLSCQQNLANTTTSPAFTFAVPGGTVSNANQGLRIQALVRFNNGGGSSSATFNLQASAGTIVAGSGLIINSTNNQMYLSGVMMWSSNTSFTASFFGGPNGSGLVLPDTSTMGPITISGGNTWSGGFTLNLNMPGTPSGGDSVTPLLFLVEYIH